MKALTLLISGTILLAIFFQCCPSSAPEEPAAPPPAQEPTLPPPTATVTIWTLEAPGGLTHALFTEDALIDESCLDCVLGDLPGGTKLSPAEGGCQQASWDTGDPEIHPGGPYIYCHVLVLDGDLAGTFGWVNQNFIAK